MQQDFVLHVLVALYNINRGRLEKLSDVPQNGRRLIQKFLYQHILAGGGGVDGDHKGAQAVQFTIFVFLYEGHVAVDFQSVIVKTVVKGIGIDCRHFPQHSKLSQKLPVVCPAAVGDGQDPVKAPSLL